MLRFYLNDRLVEEASASSNQTLLRYLRSLPRLSGTKEGCAEGDCGACTVVIIDKELDGTPAYKAINSCIVLLPSLHGKRVYTVEGLRRNGDYHPVQEAMVEALGSQCGYCTPGFVMSLFAAYYRKDITESWQKEDQLAGNLCRCTGYRPIRDALEETVGKAPEDHFAAQLKK
ncbi:MAG: 2Fe-2S iron-sulfur cluster-binding protein, partial [Myxococcota bacterium]|nr:2Fe-2S iron-sulfur cluster-binding protein [Myxococcota bacterium]